MQPFHQNFSEDMEVKPIRVLPVDKYVSVDNGIISIKNTKLHTELNIQKNYCPHKYEELMSLAYLEILSNVKSILQHASFDNIIVDLSGGMDSRLVFCAITHFPEFADKISINSQYSEIDFDDLAVAQEVSSFYSYKFDSLPREKFLLEGSNLVDSNWSYNLGVSYSYSPIVQGMRIPKTARINGFYGEICARPYYARRMMGTVLDTSSVEEFCDRYFRQHQKSAFGPSGLDTLKQIFQNELSIMPGDSPLEKLDNHYMFYRNGLHCSDRFRSNVSCPEFGPIQSKFLHQAKNMSYQNFRGAKVQLDMINMLNPAIASLRFENAYDNKDKIAIREKFGIMGEAWAHDIKLTPQDVSAKWQAAKDNIKVTDTTVDEVKMAKHAEKYRSFERDHFEMALYFLKNLYDEGLISSEETAKSIWNIFYNIEAKSISRSIRWNILNRLASLHMQMQLVKNSSEGVKKLAPSDP